MLLAEGSGFRQQQGHQRHDQQGHHTADDEGGLPVLAGKHRHHRRERAAQGNAAIHDADGGAAVALAHGLGAQGDQVGQGGAQAQAGHETHQQQAGVALDVGRAQGKHAEQQHGTDEDFLAADAIGDPAAKKRPGQQADDPGAEHPAHHLRVQGKTLAQPGGSGAGGLQIETLDQRNDKAQSDCQRRTTRWAVHGWNLIVVFVVESSRPIARGTL
ncbi:hypothetical protein D3C76_857100 [compost metagenome]